MAAVIAPAVVVPIVVLALLLVLALWYRRRRAAFGAAASNGEAEGLQEQLNNDAGSQVSGSEVDLNRLSALSRGSVLSRAPSDVQIRVP